MELKQLLAVRAPDPVALLIVLNGIETRCAGVRQRAGVRLLIVLNGIETTKRGGTNTFTRAFNRTKWN